MGLRCVCDQFGAKACKGWTPFERVRAFFYVLAVGGVRFADAQHVVSIKITDEEVIFTASRFKATKGDSVETFSVPL